jgi:hypothetical protein
MILKEVELFYTNDYRYFPSEHKTIIKLKNVNATESEGWIRFANAEYSEESYVEPLQKFIDSKQVLWVSMDSVKLPVVISDNVKMNHKLLISMDLKVIE